MDRPSTKLQILDTDYVGSSPISTGYHVEDIAKIGDHRRSMLITDWTVCSKNEAASAIVADINSGTAMTA